MSGRAAIEGAQPSRNESHLRHKRGHSDSYPHRGVLVRDEHGLVVGVLQSFEDRTNREPREEGVKSSGHADEITGSNATISNSKISNSKISNSKICNSKISNLKSSNLMTSVTKPAKGTACGS